MAFRTVNNLNELINNYQKEVLKKEDKEITIREIMESVGEFSGVTWNNIKQIKNKDSQPSIAVALKIAEFFNTSVEEIFSVEEVDDLYVKSRPKKNKEKPKCKQPNCERTSFARGYCNKHYQQFRNHNKELFEKDKQDTCLENECNNPYHAKGYCSFHYNKFYREGRFNE